MEEAAFQHLRQRSQRLEVGVVADGLAGQGDVDGVVDSTGAGDYYTAGFAHGVMLGYDFLHAARIGNVAGGLNTTQVGAQGFRLNAPDVDRFAEEMEAVGS